MIRKSLLSALVAALLGVGVVGVVAPLPTTVGHVAAPGANICGMCARGL